MLRKKVNLYGFVFIVASILVIVTKSPWILWFYVAYALFFVLMMMTTIHGLESSQQDLKEQYSEDIVETKGIADERFVQVINAIPSALVYINQKGTFDISNTYFRKLIGDTPVSVYDKTLNPTIQKIVLSAYLHEKEYTTQMNLEGIEYQVLSVPLVVHARFNGCIVMFEDVTHIMESEKQQKRFVEDASHELRTPIASIKGMVEILNEPTFDDEATRKEFLTQIEKESNRLTQLSEDLLLQSRMRSNKVYLDKTFINLRQFFDALIRDKRKKLANAHIEVTLNCDEQLIVFADRFRLSQVFNNLFNNALNYAEDASITIDCEGLNEFVKISFADSGTGIDAEILPHIFERFFRGNSDRSRLEGGSGLGLAISKSIIEAHGGSIEVFSEPSKGTRFEILLYDETKSH